MTKRKQIAVGCRVGRLTVEEPTAGRKNGYVIWRCSCSCGGEILLDTRCLQRETVVDCGCLTRVRQGQKDLTGQRFGRLLCLEATDERDRKGGTVWRCQCDCGNECLVPIHQLSSGYKKSCGCLGHPPLKDFVGKRFGMLRVVEYAGKRKGMHRWRCECDCGRQTVAGQTLLQSGKTKSCGCLQKQVYAENLKLIDGTSVTILESVKKRVRASNTSGYTGVYQNKKNGKWVANISFKGKKYYLGSYGRLKDAVTARRRGEEMYDDFLTWYYEEYCAAKKGMDRGKERENCGESAEGRRDRHS